MRKNFTRMNKFSGICKKWCRLAGVAAMSSATYYQTEIATEQLENTAEQPVAVDLKQIAEQMTHKYLLQQTCTVSVNSSSQMITIALVALADASQKYKDKLVKIIDLLENNEWSDSELENMLMEFRYDIADAKTFYLDSISATDSALNLGQSSVQMAFTVSANTVFNSMSERIYSAEREFQSCMEEIKQVEDKFTKILADTLKKSKNDVDIVK